MTELESMSGEERIRLGSAAFRATKAYPGPVGELVCREIKVWADFGYRFGGHELMSRLVEDVLEKDLG